MKVELERAPGGGSSAAVGPLDPVDSAVSLLREVDRLMARLLRCIQQAGGVSRDGLPARRLIGLAGDVTGAEAAFLERCVQTLSAMPETWQAFDQGCLSWSQVRTIVMAARDLSVAQRQTLDDQLAAAVGTARDVEPDRIGEITADLAWRIDRQAVDTAAETAPDHASAVCQPSFDGWGDWYIHADPELNAVLGQAMNAAANRPTAAQAPAGHDHHLDTPNDAVGDDDLTADVSDDDVVRDDEGTAIPKTYRDTRPRRVQLAEGLYRALSEWLATPAPGRPARPRLSAIVDVKDLLADSDGPDGRATGRLLWQTAGGSTRISQVTARAWACDATMVPIITDGTLIMAAGRGDTPVTKPLRDALDARDQGCRFPGCRAPARWTDAHHVIPRPGPTDTTNMVLLCRRCHLRVHAPGWTQTLQPDGTYIVAHGRTRLVSRPPLRPTQARPTQARPI